MAGSFILYLGLSFLIQSDAQWALKLHFTKAKEKRGSVFHYFPASRKEAEIFLVETLDQENIIVKESCGMGRWNRSLPKWRGNIFIPIIAM